MPLIAQPLPLGVHREEDGAAGFGVNVHGLLFDRAGGLRIGFGHGELGRRGQNVLLALHHPDGGRELSRDGLAVGEQERHRHRRVGRAGFLRPGASVGGLDVEDEIIGVLRLEGLAGEHVVFGSGRRVHPGEGGDAEKFADAQGESALLGIPSGDGSLEPADGDGVELLRRVLAGEFEGGGEDAGLDVDVRVGLGRDLDGILPEGHRDSTGSHIRGGASFRQSPFGAGSRLQVIDDLILMPADESGIRGEVFARGPVVPGGLAEGRALGGDVVVVIGSRAVLRLHGDQGVQFHVADGVAGAGDLTAEDQRAVGADVFLLEGELFSFVAVDVNVHNGLVRAEGFPVPGVPRVGLRRDQEEEKLIAVTRDEQSVLAEHQFRLRRVAPHDHVHRHREHGIGADEPVFLGF